MNARLPDIVGERHTAIIAFEEADRNCGGILIQPPVRLSDDLLEDASEGFTDMREWSSGIDGTHIRFTIAPPATYEDVNVADEGAMTRRAHDMVAAAARRLVDEADATASSKLFKKLYGVEKVTTTDGN